MTVTKDKSPKRAWVFWAILFVGAIGAMVTWMVRPDWFKLPEPLTLAEQEPIWGQLQVEGLETFTIGSTIRITLEVETKPAVEWVLPDLATELPAVMEVFRTYPVQVQNFAGGVRKRIRYDLTCWQSGKYTLPSLKIPYRDETGTGNEYLIPGRLITIESVLPQAKTAPELLTLNIKGIKEPRGLAGNYEIVLIYIGLAVIITGLVFYCRYIQSCRSIEKAPPKIEIPPEPADVVALRRLADLERSSYLENHNYLHFYIELSECLRRYMEERYRIMALEMTTEEFLKHLTRGDWLTRQQQAIVREVLSISDLVKFAKNYSTVDEARRALNYVEQLIMDTRERVLVEPGNPIGEVTIAGGSR